MDDNLDELKEVKETINEKIKVIIENSDSDKDIKQLKSLSFRAILLSCCKKINNLCAIFEHFRQCSNPQKVPAVCLPS